MFEGSGHRRLLRFELLRSRPREAFDRLTSFLGSQHRGKSSKSMDLSMGDLKRLAVFFEYYFE